MLSSYKQKRMPPNPVALIQSHRSEIEKLDHALREQRRRRRRDAYRDYVAYLRRLPVLMEESARDVLAASDARIVDRTRQ